MPARVPASGGGIWTGSLAEAANPAPSAGGLPVLAAADGSGPGAPDRELGAEALRAVSSDLSESALHWTQHLLDSFGIVSRELAQQLSPFGWDELFPVLKQLEQWGAVTRGLLVEGVGTLQFARREGLEAVRHAVPGGDAVTVLAATDPANPFGLAADWPAAPGSGFSRKSGSFLVLRHGKWRFWLENNGRHIVDLTTAAGEPAASGRPDAALSAMLAEIFRTLLRQQKLSKIKIDRWNSIPVLESPASEDAAGAGRGARQPLARDSAERPEVAGTPSASPAFLTRRRSPPAVVRSHSSPLR